MKQDFKKKTSNQSSKGIEVTSQMKRLIELYIFINLNFTIFLIIQLISISKLECANIINDRLAIIDKEIKKEGSEHQDKKYKFPKEIPSENHEIKSQRNHNNYNLAGIRKF